MPFETALCEKSGEYTSMKYHLLPAVILLALCAGCRSDLYYQEKAVESARRFIYKNARELTPEQFAFVRLTPPVLLTGPILDRNEKNNVENSLAGGEKIQICIAWRIPELKTDYLVFGMSQPQMAFWRPLKLIRRRLDKLDKNSVAALATARDYAVSALNGPLEFADLNLVRFSHPELVLTSFPLEFSEEKKVEEQAPNAPPVRKKPEEKTIRPWKKYPLPEKDKEGMIQLSLIWKISGTRYAVFCGVGKEDLSGWQIALAGVFDADEVKQATVKVIKTSDRFLYPLPREAAVQKDGGKKTVAGKKSATEAK